MKTIYKYIVGIAESLRDEISNTDLDEEEIIGDIEAVDVEEL